MVGLLTTPLPPHLYDLMAIGVMLVFAFRGYRRGFMKEAFGISSLFLSIPLARPFGMALRNVLPLNYVPAFLQQNIHDAAGGILAYFSLIVFFYIIERIITESWKPKEYVHTISHIGGAVVGAGFAFIILIIITWLVLALGTISHGALQQYNAQKEKGEETNDLLLLPALMVDAHKDSLAESIIGRMSGITTPLPQSVTQGIDVANTVVDNPQKMQKLIDSDDIAEIMQKDSVQNLVQNKEIQELANEGNIMGLMNHPAMKQILADPDLQKSLQTIDMNALLKHIDGNLLKNFFLFAQPK